mmetsp:Transcript_40261/g.106632  ORF Transcript_40261/g.106632 Transcript_40261/m.106632 type:complete len:100 (+) Transcript_40261:400-699(+)
MSPIVQLAAAADRGHPSAQLERCCSRCAHVGVLVQCVCYTLLADALAVVSCADGAIAPGPLLWTSTPGVGGDKACVLRWGYGGEDTSMAKPLAEHTEAY